MIGVLLATHSNMCNGVKESSEMIIGDVSMIYTISLTEEGVDLFREKLETVLNQMQESYQDIIIVTDIPNATPYNECYRYMLQHRESVSVISGMNLAMVIELAIYSSIEKREKLVSKVIETGRASIIDITY